TIHSEQKTLSSLSNATYNNLSALNFSSNLATNTRLAKMSNPYNKDERFAEWIKSMKGKTLASNDVSSDKILLAAVSKDGKSPTNHPIQSNQASYLNDAVQAYDSLRFNAIHNLWGNIGSVIGNSNGVGSLSGAFNFGYDAWVQNMILGAYGSYAYTTNSIANLSSKNQSHNVDIGFYGRFFLQSNEIDVNIGETFGFNSLAIQEDLLQTTLKGNSINFQTHLDLTYGYVFKIGSGWFSKPFVGVGYNYGYSMGMDAKATDISLGFSPYQSHFINVQIGLEVRKYFNENQSYFYIAPAFYQGVLLDNTQNTTTTIYDASFSKASSDFNQNNAIDTSFLLKIGGEWQASSRWYVNASIGTKLGNINQYGMINLGARWKF
ncbi:autotransporter outer membrane beta-barrel domain-containing protein, partial [Helicobacter sp. 13S00477-4]|uniref:autotransporter outer membrane beta-barrel domain-containing protein n=1 Tax=Helicobacter sp. 13S00477-4 TaxID=1905759 RepID=UPI00117ACFAA